MNRPTAPISSKGQITLPKTIRDILKVKQGDTINFYVHSNGEVLIRKSNDITTVEAIQNAAEFVFNYFNENDILTISGYVGSGKTTLATQLLDASFRGKNIVVIDSKYGDLVHLLKKESILKFEQLISMTYETIDIEKILEVTPDLVVFDEGHNLEDIQLISKLSSMRVKILFVTLDINENIQKQIGTCYNLIANRTKLLNIESIEKVSIENEEVFQTLIYKN
ncbi:AbrB/MazE/SpoVT family DNA-binding domain-containing protein [Butyricicoccus sp. 1XD8-22]|nr:AbrB/MazE/SpoVT family DNA-binding domain-containing protein [Butyricicoccus sp. 1XD8-22]